MAKVAVEQFMTGNSVRFPATDMSTYNATKHNLGPIFYQGTDSWSGSETFIGPAPTIVGRPVETTIATAAGFPHAIQVSPTEWYVVLADISTAATLRKFLLYNYTLTSNTFAYIGAISFTFPTTATIKGIRFQRSLHTTGTVSVSGTTVTGSGTDWLTRRVNAGSRIGFGSSDPTQISTWYEITPGSAISSNTSLSVTSTPGTITAGTAYVIEDYSLIIHAVCNTNTDGGLRVIKGLNPMTSCWSTSATATVISLGTTIDNIRACYWLKDASTITNLVGVGLALNDLSSDNLTQDCYCLDGTSSTTVKIFKFNVKKALTLTSGVDTTAFSLVTGVPTVTGSAAATIHNCRIGTLSHGPGAGVKCLYFTTLTRLYRVILSNITSGATTFLSDAMLEVPPGSINTLPATGAMSNLEIMDSMDRIAWFSTGATAFRHYVTQYRTDSSQLDHTWCSDDKIQHSGVADATAIPYPSTNSTSITSWAESGMMFLARHGTTAALNQVYTFPIAAHWGYQNIAPFNVYITPEIATPGNTKFYRLYVTNPTLLGGDNLGVSPEAYKVYYRTAGISDNSGSWNSLSSDYDLSGVGAAGSIQFKFEFRVLSPTPIPARIYGLAVVYDSGTDIPAQHRWNVDDSSTTDGTIGFIQVALYGASIPTLTINYYRADTNANVLTQASSGSTNGVFEYHNGSTWVAGLGSDTLGTRRRFRPTAGLPNGIAVYTKLS